MSKCSTAGKEGWQNTWPDLYMQEHSGKSGRHTNGIQWKNETVNTMQCVSVPETEASHSKDMGTFFFLLLPHLLHRLISWIHKIFRDCIKKKNLGIQGKSPHTCQRPRVKFISTNISPYFDYPLNARTLNNKH